MLIGIDAGHGGSDPGAVGRVHGTKEKDITLGIAYKLRQLFWDNNIGVVMTRDRDMTASLGYRTALFNKLKCDIAVSVHVNSVPEPEPDYIATFIQATGGRAEQVAKLVQGELVKATGWKDGGVKVNNLHMTRETTMSAILVECGFLSNAEQEAELIQAEVQDKIAQAICAGVLRYLNVGTKEAGPVTTDEALNVLKDKGVISDTAYWAQVVNCVKYMDTLVVNVAEKLKGVQG